MPHRDIFIEVLHEAQATGKGAVSMHTSNTINSIDPRLIGSILSASTSASPVPSLYKKSRKRVKVEISNDEEGGGLV
jgi:hypothetical protein